MELITFIVIFINAIIISVFMNIDFITALFASPFISLIIFPITGFEIAIIYFLLQLSKEPFENKL